MIDDQSKAKQALQRIAAALGTDPRVFLAERRGLGTVQETLELLRAFERVVDQDDRRACIDFVCSMAAKRCTP